MLLPEDKEHPLKIIDFGSSCDWSDPLKRGIGEATFDPMYGPPEKTIQYQPRDAPIYSTILAQQYHPPYTPMTAYWTTVLPTALSLVLSSYAIMSYFLRDMSLPSYAPPATRALCCVRYCTP
eukprot:1890919-Rhodomonas_salina.3